MVLAKSVLATSLPVKAPEVLLSFHQAVVVAPHPDDETLGCGGAIVYLRQHNISVQVLILSDGTGSHPNSKRFPADKLRQIREDEVYAALEILGVGADSVTFFRWPDTAVPRLEDNSGRTQRFSEAVERCDRYLQAHSPDLIFVPWQYDHHCDHRAAWQIVDCCLQSWSPPPRRLIYSIWGDRTAGLATIPEDTTGWRLDIRTVKDLKYRAAMAYKSQTTDLIDDDPEGFRLTTEMLNNLIQPYETYLEID